MPHWTLADVVRRRFIHCANHHALSIAEIVDQIGLPAAELCTLIAGQRVDQRPLRTYVRLARWLHMPLARVLELAGARVKLADLVRLGMTRAGQCPTRACDQAAAADAAGVSVATFRRALHGYASFRPSSQTCDRLATWLAWTGLESDEIATAAGMVVCYKPNGRRITAPADAAAATPYPCACGRPGCMVPAHIPHGPRRKWRRDACRMWSARRRARVNTPQHARQAPYPTRTARVIMINARPVPVAL